MDIPVFRYMAWAKANQGRAKYPLLLSGVPAPSLADLGLGADAVQLSRPHTPNPDEGLAAAVSARYGAPADCVMPACGTHHANFLLARVLAGPGTKVLVETPNYEDVPGVFKVVGAEVTLFHRRPEEGWRLPIAEIRRGLASGARVVAVTDLHNPGGAHLQPDDLAALEAAGREFEATILVDEVYRDFLPPPIGTCFLPGGPFVVTSSLTKVYGFGDLRIGWALAQPDLVARMRDLNDYVVVNMPAPSASIALAAWDRLDGIAARNREFAARHLRIANAWIRGRKDLRWCPPDGGISGFVQAQRLEGKDDVAWVEGLLSETCVGVVPGTMFGAPGGFRLGFGCPTELLEEGLTRLGAHLDRTR